MSIHHFIIIMRFKLLLAYFFLLTLTIITPAYDLIYPLILYSTLLNYSIIALILNFNSQWRVSEFLFL